MKGKPCLLVLLLGAIEVARSTDVSQSVVDQVCQLRHRVACYHPRQAYYSKSEGSCECRCAPRACGEGQVQAPDSCLCVNLCQRPKVYEPHSRTCRCPSNSIYDPQNRRCRCPGNKRWYVDTERCECYCPPHFTAIEHPNHHCSCHCSKVCPEKEKLFLDSIAKICDCICCPGAVRNDNTKVCECLPGSVWNPTTSVCDCLPGLVWNDGTRCECPYKYQYYDEEQKVCLCPKCPPYFESYINADHECSCRCTLICEGPAYRDPDRRYCRCLCPAPLEYNTASQQCECPYKHQYYDEEQGVCLCPTCPPYFESYINADHECSCRCTLTCEGPAYRDPNPRYCRCLCPAPRKYNVATQQCECPYKHQYYDEEQGVCLCPTCPPYFESYINADHECSCRCTLTCEGPAYLDPDARYCRCLCPPTLEYNVATRQCECPPGTLYDPFANECYCPITDQTYNTLQKKCVCLGDKQLSDDGTRCVCSPCGKYFTVEDLGDECKCNCTRQCPSGYTLNPDRCECKCSKTCPEYYELDRDSCQCVCAKGCPQYYQLNPDRCECECSKTCPHYYELDRDSCQCVCAKGCPSGYTLDREACQCVCSKKCPQYYQLNRDRCQCECSRTCPSGYRLNSHTCQCECSRTCQSGYRLNSHTCQCAGGCSRTCPSGYALNRPTCTCHRIPLHCYCQSTSSHVWSRLFCPRLGSQATCHRPNDGLYCRWSCVKCCTHHSSAPHDAVDCGNKYSKAQCNYPSDGHVCQWNSNC